MITRKSEIKIYVDTPYWFVRPRNTDWRYTLSLKGMGKYAPFDIQFSREHRLMCEANIQWLRAKLGFFDTPSLQRKLRAAAMSQFNSDVVYSHGKFPVVTGKKIPVGWLHGVVDPIMRIKAGVSPAAIDHEYCYMRPAFEQADIVLCPTQSFAQRHRKRFPDIASRFVYVPFFVDGLESISESELVLKQRDDDELRLIFVGREAYRKGLDVVLAGLILARRFGQRNLTIDVIADEPYLRKKYADNESVRWHGEMSREGVLRLMRSAHIFVMPSRYESYGFVYLEAMSMGCAVIAAAWESQQEICDHGRAGLLINSDANEFASALLDLCEYERRTDMALNGLLRFQNEYSPSAAATMHYKAFSRLI